MKEDLVIAGENIRNEIKPFDLPKIQWEISDLKFFISLILSLITIIIPKIVSEDLKLFYRIGMVVIVFLVSYIVYTLLCWLFKYLLIIHSRVKYYDKVYDKSVRLKDKTEELEKFLITLMKLTFGNLYYIKKAHYQNKEVTILFHKSESLENYDNLKVYVFDIEDGYFMGCFKVIDSKDNNYYAVQYGYIDPVWVGYIRQSSEVTMFPKLRVCLISGGN